MPNPDYAARSRQAALAIVDELNQTVAIKSEDGNDDIEPARFTASFNSLQDYKVSELNTLHVDARDAGWLLDVESRKGGKDHYQVEISVQQAVDKKDESAIALLKDLTGRIARKFSPRVFLAVNMTNAIEAEEMQVISTSCLLYAPDKLNQNRYFGLVSITLAEFVER